MFARIDFSTFVACCSGYLSVNESEEKLSVAICGGSICILTGLQGRSISTSGGLILLITYVDQSFQHDIISNINQHTLWEGLVLRIKGGRLPKGIIIGNIYRPPRMLKDEFINEFTLLILSLEKHRLNINLAGDYNNYLNLL